MNTEIDPVIRNCIKLLHSDSKLKLRTALDEIIKQKYGPNKILSNIFGRKYLNEESSPPPTTVSVSSSSSVAGIGGTIKRHKSDDSSSSSSGRTTSSPIPIITTSTSHDMMSKTFSGSTGNNNNDNDGTAGSGGVSLSINLSDMKTIDVTGEEENLTKDFGDLACIVCGQMVVTAGNRLIECTECHSLYHQECHKPCISDIDANEQEFSWCCSNCKNKLVFGNSVGGSGNNMIISGGKTLISDAGGSIEIIPSSSSTSKSTHSHSSSSSSSSSSTSSHYSSKRSTDHSGSKIRSKSSSKHDVSTSGTSLSSRGALESSNASASATITGGSSSGNGSSSKNNGNKIISSSSNNTIAPITPNINIVSADKRIESMKRKAVKQQESKKKHK